MVPNLACSIPCSSKFMLVILSDGDSPRHIIIYIVHPLVSISLSGHKGSSRALALQLTHEILPALLLLHWSLPEFKVALFHMRTMYSVIPIFSILAITLLCSAYSGSVPTFAREAYQTVPILHHPHRQVSTHWHFPWFQLLSRSH